MSYDAWRMHKKLCQGNDKAPPQFKVVDVSNQQITNFVTINKNTASNKHSEETDNQYNVIGKLIGDSFCD